MLLGHITAFAPTEDWGEQKFALVKWCIDKQFRTDQIKYKVEV